jgi:crossover junction endodeoxyribonuclease RusA
MRIEVAGIPAPQGSKRHVGGGRMVEMSRAVGPWREAVRHETQRAVAAYPDTDEATGWAFVGPVQVNVFFRLPRPKSAPRHIFWPAKRPDLDKLCRSVFDGLTEGGAWADDAQVVSMIAVKKFAMDGMAPGCTIDIVGMD